MSKVSFKVVRSDGGWTYESNAASSGQFPTREAARKAARLAAGKHTAVPDTRPCACERSGQQWLDDSG